MAASRSVWLGWRVRALDRREAVCLLEAGVWERVGVVPLDPHLPRLSPALNCDPHHGPASLEHAVTPDHEVPNAELSQESASGRPLPLPSFRESGTRAASNIPRN